MTEQKNPPKCICVYSMILKGVLCICQTIFDRLRLSLFVEYFHDALMTHSYEHIITVTCMCSTTIYQIANRLPIMQPHGTAVLS